MKRLFFVIITVSLFLPSLLVAPAAFAQITPTAVPTTTIPSGTAPSATAGDWVQDPTVTFLGKAANRAKDFMDWTLVNYKWDYLDTSLINSWNAIRNIVYTISILTVLVGAFFIIINGGRDIGIMTFTKEFIFALLLVTFSFALAHLFYQIADIFQVFFYQTAGTGNGVIIGKDIINISFASPNFVGYRRTGIGYDEASFISLLIVQVSSITFYVIGCLLTVRKILLWFFLVSAPIYLIVITYHPIKKTAKIWISEFLRWLLYAPLFALFLSAVVIIWKSSLLILPFNFNDAAPPLYPTAISILVGGPGQQLSLTNSLNYNDTFIQYVIALLMLWVAILMPFILLQILLDFLAKHDFGLNSMSGYINAIRSNVTNNGFAFLKKPPQPGPLPTGQSPAGLAREIQKHTTTTEETNLKRSTESVSEQQTSRQQAAHSPYAKINNMFGKQQATNLSQQNTQSSSQSHQTNTTNVARNQSYSTTASQDQSHTSNVSQSHSYATQMAGRPAMTAQFKPEVLARPTTRLINFPIPTMRDIVKFETARLSHAQVGTPELQQTQNTLGKIADPKSGSTPAEQEHFTVLREQLKQEKTEGDVLAKSILSAASTVQQPQEAKAGEAGAPVASPQLPIINLPVVNEIQTVSFDDYEAVKALWLENYQQIDVPDRFSSRKSWVEDDNQAVSQVITQLSSPDPLNVQEGLASVSNILPFLLIGGFSQMEVIAYLKAKCAAAKSALQELAKQEENQETLLKKGAKKAQSKELQQEVEEHNHSINN